MAIPPSPTAGLPRLQTRIGLALGALILGLALGLAVFLSRTAEQQVLQQSAAGLGNLATQMARELSSGMDRFAQAVLTQTYRESFRDPGASVESMRQALDDFQRTNPEFAYVSIVDIATARVIAAGGGIFEGGSAKGRPTFEQGIRGPFIGDVHEAVRLAELLPKPENGETLRFLDVAAPIADPSGKPFRVFATHVAWQWTDELRKAIFGPLKASMGVDAFLVDTAGKVVLSPTPQVKVGTSLQGIVGPAGSPAAVLVWPDGARYLTVAATAAPHRSFPGFGWRVVARQPEALATAPARALRSAFLLGAVVLGLAGAAAAWLVAGILVRPVRRLAEAAANLQAGAPATALASRAGVAEVSAVQQAIVGLSEAARHEHDATLAARRQFAVLADSLPQVVFQADAAGRIRELNKPWVRAAAASGDFDVADLARLLVDEDRERFAQAWRHSRATGEPLRLRCRVRADDAAPARWFEIEARAVNGGDGATIAWIGTLLDIHEMAVRAEESQRALLAERAARLEAERLAQLRDDFLATVSHELRTPLSAITGWSDILRLKSDGNTMLAKAAEVIRRNADLQARLINDLLDMTAVMAGRMVLDLEPLDLVQLAREVVQSQLPAAQAKGVALACRDGGPLIVQGDRRRLTQVVSNLVGNAIKFTEPQGRIELLAANEGADAVLRVRDDGRGIAPSFLPHVFDRMRQQDSSITRRAGGLGLGLAIVRGLVALHDGSVSAHSDGVGRGAVFTVRLPLAPELVERKPRPDGDDADAPAFDLRGRRVLLVDDEADAREVAQVALSSLGADVRLAASGAEVLHILERERFDVLVSDLGMPEMDGLTLLRTLRRRPSSGAEALPAVALTAFAMESDRRAGLEAGFQAYVTKPISLRRLSEAIGQALAAKR